MGERRERERGGRGIAALAGIDEQSASALKQKGNEGYRHRGNRA